MKKPKIFVIGASNTDLISYVSRLPKWGETLHGKRFHMGYGGKGANQAVMAAKLGGEVKIITKLGNDIFGENTLNNFKSMGIDTKYVFFTDKAFSGVAPITVDTEGNNAIIIIMGANDLLKVEEIEKARKDIAEADVMVSQLEIPVEISLAAMKIAKETGTMTIFNPAPARPALPDEIYKLSDIICPNESETEMLTGMQIKSLKDAEKAAESLLDRGAKTVILTLGKRGSILVDRKEVVHIPATKDKALDTTGAGDAFVGSLAYFLSLGKSLKDAMRRASYIAGVSVKSSGTQVSFPWAKDLPEEIVN
ncbi:MAG: ribokinase [Spirochaetes bacterium]|nr:MAG: ribokinase [Spirochaetota bacterium]